jgi:serine/threonine-protein kinase
LDQPLIVDRYRPLEELGAGGHGSVVLAFDTKMARRIAIKRLPLPPGRGAARTGLAEARAAAMLGHPNIVTIHEWETDGEHAYLVMEHIAGLSLADLLDALGAPLDEDEAAAVVRAVGDALTFAHHNGVLHLDIKPENVLIDRDGRVKVADFGVAALTGPGGAARGTGGTIGYMPPEQIRGEAVDDATDQWAFAALVYEMLTLANPFDAETAEGSLFKIEVAPVPAPSEFACDLPPGIDAVLLTALAADPADRYASTAEFTHRLLDLLGDPFAGEEALAGDVAYVLAEDSGAEEPSFATLGVWDRLAPHTRRFTRLGAAVASGWLAWAGLVPHGLGTAALAGSVALVALAAALAPGLGLALGALAFSSGLMRHSGPLWAAAFVLPASAYWAWRGRAGEGDALVVLGAPALGVLRAAASTPLIAGFTFEPAPAAAAAALAALTTMTVAAATGAPAPFLEVDWRVLLDPWSPDVLVAGVRAVFTLGPLVAAVGWSAAAAVMSLFCRHGTRLAATLGALVAAGILRVAYVPWRLLADGPALGDLAVHGGIALAVTAALIALGPPTRGE